MRTWGDLTQAAENFRNVWAVKPSEDATSGKKGRLLELELQVGRGKEADIGVLGIYWL